MAIEFLQVIATSGYPGPPARGSYAWRLIAGIGGD